MINMSRFFHCRCYFTHNIYIKNVNKHFIFVDETQFFNTYRKVLPSLGCNTEEKVETLIKEILAEVNRRKEIDKKSFERKKQIEEHYAPVHPDLYILKESFFEESFKHLIESAKSCNIQQVFKSIDVMSEDKKLYGFPVFKQDFCARFLEELDHYEESNLPKERPNTMNEYGILLDDLGFYDTFSKTLRMNYLDSLAKMLFPEWSGQGLDSHKIFTVTYKLGEDIDLGSHYDNSEVTLNVCLGKTFEGGNLYFGGMRTDPEDTYTEYSHKIGYGILHRGQQIHGALPITSGERCNLIFWMRSSSVRNLKCPMCDSTPILCESEDYGDGFTEANTVPICNLT